MTDTQTAGLWVRITAISRSLWFLLCIHTDVEMSVRVCTRTGIFGLALAPDRRPHSSPSRAPSSGTLQLALFSSVTSAMGAGLPDSKSEDSRGGGKPLGWAAGVNSVFS